MTPLVALGASLGGLRALSTILSGAPPDLGAALLVAQHRRANAEPLLAQLLARACALPVGDAYDKQPVEPAQVYVAPGDYHLLVEDDGRRLALSTEGPVRHARPSIDVLLESLAASRCEMRVAVLLTGASHDGARGAEAVQRAGGMVVVQAPDEAESPVLPRAVLARLAPDAVLPLAEIGPFLWGSLPRKAGARG
jgi:two-component system, chemotaxis family, protein-glutamate methylesterase/glutaminase